MSTLFRERYVAVLPAAHSLARKRALRVKDLREEPFILFARRKDGPPGFRQNHPPVAKEADSAPTLSRMRRNGRLWYAW
jgi:DNA-binding transcriptional LysR family regulator